MNLTKRYGSLTAVDDISFSVHRGETFGVVGPNGAGKTTRRKREITDNDGRKTSDVPPSCSKAIGRQRYDTSPMSVDHLSSVW